MILVSINGVELMAVEKEETVEQLKDAIADLAMFLGASDFPEFKTRRIEAVMGEANASFHCAVMTMLKRLKKDREEIEAEDDEADTLEA